MRMWRNWYTRTLEGRVALALRVRVSPSAFFHGKIGIKSKVKDYFYPLFPSPCPPIPTPYFIFCAFIEVGKVL